MFCREIEGEGPRIYEFTSFWLSTVDTYCQLHKYNYMLTFELGEYFGREVPSVKVRRRANKAPRACHESLTTSKVTFVCRPGHCLMSNKLVCENKYKHSCKEALEMLIKRFCEEENSWIKTLGYFRLDVRCLGARHTLSSR